MDDFTYYEELIEHVPEPPQKYGAVLRLEEGDALATSNGAILIGTDEDIRKLFGKLLVSMVPISRRTTVPLKDVRKHAPGYWKE